MIHVVCNPAGASGRAKRKFERLAPLFTEGKFPAQIHISTPGNGIREICAAIDKSRGEDPVDLVVLGGDGTVNQALNGFSNLQGLRLGLIPTGSANDLAKDLELSYDPEFLVRQILEGKEKRRSDIGCLEVLDAAGTITEKRVFLTSCGIGFDAEVCHEVDISPLKNALNKLHLGKLAYTLIAIRLIFAFSSHTTELFLDGNRSLSFPYSLLIAAMNHRYEGGGFLFGPEAKADDGLLDLCIADPANKWKFFPIFPTAFKGNHVKFDCVSMERCATADIRVPEPLWVHTDGEAFARADHIRLSLLPTQVPLLV